MTCVTSFRKSTNSCWSLQMRHSVAGTRSDVHTPGDR
jgi:hypothetical protein